jgi:ribonucleoside-diphosphate reductase beta chain
MEQSLTTQAHTKDYKALYKIAKRHGTWDPDDIPVSEDRTDWGRLNPDEKEQLLKICSLFYEGEINVAETLVWWLAAIEDSGHRAFLVSQLYEEVKHAEFFEIYFNEVFGKVDTSLYVIGEYKRILVDGLRERALEIGRRTLADKSPEAKVQLERAIVLGTAHYMGIVEGVMAVTGYDYFDEMLAARKTFSRLLEAIRLIRADEGRHITGGMNYLRAKVAENPEHANAVREVFMQEGMKIPAATDFVFQPNAFQLDRDRMLSIAYEHFNQRSSEIGLM